MCPLTRGAEGWACSGGRCLCAGDRFARSMSNASFPLPSRDLRGTRSSLSGCGRSGPADGTWRPRWWSGRRSCQGHSDDGSTGVGGRLPVLPGPLRVSGDSDSGARGNSQGRRTVYRATTLFQIRPKMAVEYIPLDTLETGGFVEPELISTVWEIPQVPTSGTALRRRVYSSVFSSQVCN